jgi:hypothetical protein
MERQHLCGPECSICVKNVLLFLEEPFNLQTIQVGLACLDHVMKKCTLPDTLTITQIGEDLLPRSRRGGSITKIVVMSKEKCLPGGIMTNQTLAIEAKTTKIRVFPSQKTGKAPQRGQNYTYPDPYEKPEKAPRRSGGETKLLGPARDWQCSNDKIEQ